MGNCKLIHLSKILLICPKLSLFWPFLCTALPAFSVSWKEQNQRKTNVGFFCEFFEKQLLLLTVKVGQTWLQIMSGKYLNVSNTFLTKLSVLKSFEKTFMSNFFFFVCFSFLLFCFCCFIVSWWKVIHVGHQLQKKG